MVRNACYGRLFQKQWKHHATIVRTDLILVERSPGWELYIELRVTINAGRLSLVPRSACGGSFICARILSFSDSRWVWMGDGRLNLSLPLISQ